MISASSFSRPTNDVSCSGRLVSIASSERRGGNFFPEVWLAQLVDLLGQREIFKAVFAQVAQRNAWRELVPGDRRRRAGNQYLAAVPDCQQPRSPVDRRTKIVALALVGSSGMDGRAYAKSAQRRKILVVKRALRGEHCGEGVGGAGKGGTESVAEGLEDVSPMRDDRLPNERVVTAHGTFHFVAIAFPALRAAFDVGKGERHRSAGKRSSISVRKQIRRGLHLD